MRPVAYRIFSKKHGLNLKSTGLDTLTEIIGKDYGTEWRGAEAAKMMEEVCRLWKEQEMGVFVEGKPLQELYDEITASKKAKKKARVQVVSESVELVGEEELDALDGDQPQVNVIRETAPSVDVVWKEFFKVIGAFDQPLFHYNARQQRFEKRKTKPSLFANAQSASNMFLTRYHLVYNRLLRNDDTTDLKITSIRSLIGRQGDFSIFGMLSKNPEQKICLQDDTGRILLILAAGCKPDPGVYYPEGSFVICHGRYIKSGDAEVFVVVNMGPPVAEKRQDTITAYGNMDYLGLHGNPHGSVVRRIERQVEASMIAEEKRLLDQKVIVFGGDMHLDNPLTLKALHKVFSTIELEFQASGIKKPLAMVFSGDFTSQYQPPHLYKQGFDKLEELFKEFSSIITGVKIIFVPGQRDPWTNTFPTQNAVVPLQPLPATMINRIARLCGEDVSMSTNPCRMAYLTQDMVFYRDGISERLRKCNLQLDSAKDDSNDEEEDNIEIDDDGDDVEIIAAAVNEPESSFDFGNGLSNLTRPVDISTPLGSQVGPTNTLSAKEIESRKIVRTICDQGHLSPFNRHDRPVVWDYDETLWLSPLPTILFMIDTHAPKFSLRYEECMVVNPGPFLNRKVANWVEYDPAKKLVKERQLHI
ncbi:DNA polymerase epsilon subunit B [Yarrowia sp. C11]|nr:DNA polymerase epsilon subunit B [Yarrowia sp. E02]KAG5371410.1 DNA polymerase epsilon subunit B [Yarrowia sp. C11]